MVDNQYVLTCGSCHATHTLTGEHAVIAAEIATFMAAHRDHDAFTITTSRPRRDDVTDPG